MSMIFADNGELHPVYFAVTKRGGKTMYRRAPFDVVVVDGNPHIQPRSIGSTDAALTNLNTAATNEDQITWRSDMAYETLEPYVIDENQMGDGSDNWIGMHSVSNC